MKSKLNTLSGFVACPAADELARRAVAFSITVLLCLASHSFVQAQGRSAGAPKVFGTAKEAAEALVAASASFDEAGLKEILGANSRDLIYSGESVADREIAMEFGKKGRDKITLTPAPRNPRLVMFAVGEDNWPSPFPIVKKARGWSFDPDAARTELIYRRVGRNELDAIKICRGFVEAQHEYALEKHDGSPVNQYAKRIISSPGRQDGLAWRNADGSAGGPIGEEVAKAIEKGYTDPQSSFRGYRFKVLEGQGPAAPHGKLNFMIGGYMIGGFALLAYPAYHGLTGVKSFIVSHDGVVYEKDLGPNTLEVVKTIELFNPDKTWVPVLDDDDDDGDGEDVDK